MEGAIQQWFRGARSEVIGLRNVRRPGLSSLSAGSLLPSVQTSTSASTMSRRSGRLTSSRVRPGDGEDHALVDEELSEPEYDAHH
jgi:hypothetical protein